MPSSQVQSRSVVVLPKPETLTLVGVKTAAELHLLSFGSSHSLTRADLMRREQWLSDQQQCIQLLQIDSLGFQEGRCWHIDSDNWIRESTAKQEVAYLARQRGGYYDKP